MKTSQTIKTAFSGLTTHKARSALTMLGIVIGVAAIILVMSIGNGAQALIVNTISELGAETAVVQPGSPDGGFEEVFLTKSITEDDVEALSQPSNVPDLVELMPVVAVSENVSYRDEVYSPMVMGGVADFFIDTFDIYPQRGTSFSENDIRTRSRVAIIGEGVEEELFGVGGEAVGESIRIKNEKFRVVGVFPSKGNLGFFNIDEMVLIPYTTAQTYLTGDNYLTEIVIRANEADSVDRMVYDVEATMRESHNLSPGDEDDFVVRTQQGLVDQVSTIVLVLTMFLASVVAISLIVGGVGIMNIMLVSVTERTKEIGLRKALGATRKDILTQFLLEAVILTGAGGIVGIVIGSGVSLIISVIVSEFILEGWEFVFPISGALLGVGVSALVGIVFGLYPASQASKKSPIEALRYE